MRDPLHTLQEGEVFVVATLAEGKLVDLEVRSRPPTFPLREGQVALVANVDGGDSAEFLTIGDLVGHCADTLGMDTDDEEGPYEPEAMAENILESIGFNATAGIDTDSRAEIGDRLLMALEADTVADPDQVAGAVATALALEQPQGVRLIEALVEVAAGGQYCEGCERTGKPLNKAGFCPDCVAAAVAAGHADRVGEEQP